MEKGYIIIITKCKSLLQIPEEHIEKIFISKKGIVEVTTDYENLKLSIDYIEEIYFLRLREVEKDTYRETFRNTLYRKEK